MLNLLIIVVFIVQFCTNITDADVIVSLPKGDIRGSELFAYNNTPYYAFQQVPFAAPPVGKLRFQPPVEPESWNGTYLNATESTKICYQWNSNNARQTEDCLYLNVYTPVKPGASANKSVIVFFYGGAFLTGSYRYEIYPPEYYIYHDVVVVVPNYRVGPFGFLSTQDTTIPGNYGLKDQLFVLQWVQKNIHLFGGDPTKVTINGQSAGAASVGYHLVSKKSAGLFRGAILESGSVLSSYAIQRYAKKIAYQLAQKINANFTTNNTSEELLSLLQNTSADTINGISLPDLFGVQLGQGSTFSPVIEPKHDGAFITDFMHESLRNGDFNVVPAIIGINSEERIFEAADLDAFKALMTQYDDDLKLIVNDDFNVSDENKQTVGEKLRQIYTDGKFQDNLGASIRFKSDVRYSTCIVRHAFLQSNYSDVYFYQFSYHGEIAGNEVSIDGADRVQHSEELIYLWPQYGKNVINYPKGDIIAHIRLITLWTNFVKYLNPTPEPVELFENITWPTLKPNNLQYLNINDTLEIRVNPRQYKSWVGIIEEYGNPPFDTF